MPDPIVVRRHISAPPEKVYRYLTESERWSRWQGTAATIEAVPGGSFGISMPNGQRALGEFVELEQDRRVVFTWGWVGHTGLPPGSSTVEIELTATDDGTLVTLTHTGLAPDEMDLHRAGWEHYLPRLAIAATGDDPGVDPGPG